MSQTNCCPVMDLQWTQRVIDNQWADVYFCASCGHVHRAEKYALPMRFPLQNRCVNCSGDLRLIQPEAGPDPRNIACTTCGLTAVECHETHQRYAQLHPHGDFLAASEALSDLRRYVLALKLATAETRWGPNPVMGEIQRLAVLDAMGQSDRALDEAYEWSDNEGTPVDVFGVIATLEAGAGNLRGAVTALERGLNQAPERHDWWCDYAEIMVHLDDRPGAVRAAAHAVKDPENESRAVQVMAEVGERFYANGQMAEALGACSLAGDRQERYVAITWLRARIAAVNQDTEYLMKWLEETLKLDPNHAEAREMLEPYKKKTGWFRW
jgi:tetratricopeptide (TPR) repeat protein